MIILASASPRRRELLEQIGEEFVVKVSEAEEVKSANSPLELAEKNAKLKALAVAKEHREYPVLGADTIVVLDGKIYGKPKDEQDARQMLKSFSGRVHEVLTGICLVKDEKIYSKTVRTEVTFGEMTEKEIEEYIATKEPMDKAGAYAIQGKAARFIKCINGSFSNVVGLPLHELNELLKEAKLKNRV
ncbi:MAG: septum formation inhibitor Maf [Selenomonadaceae bacterium]|nr:septum formation inhibitor Maf [Selenomonadaceae bacterium]